MSVQGIADHPDPNGQTPPGPASAEPGPRPAVRAGSSAALTGSSRPAPATPRDTFELFASYRPETGLDGLFDGIDLATVTPRQIYYAVHGRPPERIEYAIPGPDFSPLRRYVTALASQEFRSNIMNDLLAAFPERKRLLFLHIPRGAGAELSARLMTRYPFLNSQISWLGWLTPQEFYLAIRQFVLEASTSDTVFVGGHNTIENYRRWRAMRFQDNIFAILREPREMIISQLNYVLTRMFVKATPPRPDTVGWRKRFGVADIAGPPSRSEAIALARKILQDPGVVVPNTICRYLGDGAAARAIENVVIHAIELTDFHHYDAWCRSRWGIDRRSRSNRSASYVTLEDFAADDRDYMATITAEDAQVYQLAQQAFAKRGGTSITGSEIL